MRLIIFAVLLMVFFFINFQVLRKTCRFRLNVLTAFRKKIRSKEFDDSEFILFFDLIDAVAAEKIARRALSKKSGLPLLAETAITDDDVERVVNFNIIELDAMLASSFRHFCICEAAMALLLIPLILLLLMFRGR